MARILVIGKYYFPFEGGIEAYTRDVCEALAQRHEVSAIVFNHENGRAREIVNGVHVHRCRREFTVKGQPISLDLLDAIKLTDADLIHFHAPNFMAAAVLLAKLAVTQRKIPLIITHHSDVHGRRVLRQFVIPTYKSLVRRAAAVIVTSAKNAALSVDLPDGLSTIVIPLGVDPDRYRVTNDDREAARVWKRELAGDSPTVAFVGRHARYKGLIELIQATAQVEGLHALVAGEGPAQASARELVASLEISGRVHFLGRISEQQKRRLLSVCDVFAFPSTEITEGFGLSLLEAMAMGASIVASELPTGVSDLAINEETALTVPPGDADALAQGIMRLLSDPTLAEQLGSRARAHSKDRFTRAMMLERTCDLIERNLVSVKTTARMAPLLGGASGNLQHNLVQAVQGGNADITMVGRRRLSSSRSMRARSGAPHGEDALPFPPWRAPPVHTSPVCPALSTRASLGQCIESTQNGGITVPAEGCDLISAQDVVVKAKAAQAAEGTRVATDA